MSFTVLLCLAGIATAVYAVIHRKELGNLTGGVPRRRSTSAIIGIGVLLFLVGLALYFRSRGWTGRRG